MQSCAIVHIVQINLLVGASQNLPDAFPKKPPKRTSQKPSGCPSDAPLGQRIPALRGLKALTLRQCLYYLFTKKQGVIPEVSSLHIIKNTLNLFHVVSIWQMHEAKKR